MKRIWILPLLLLGLAGCGGQKAPAAASAAPSPEVWGVTMEEAQASPSPEAEHSAAEASDAEASNTEASNTEASETEPEPPASLAELYAPGPEVLVDGAHLDSLLIADTTLVNAADAEALWPWLSGTGDGKTWTAEDAAGESVQIACGAPEDFTGTEGIFFAGQTEEYWLPVRWLCEQFEKELLWDGTEGTVFVTTPVDADAIPEGVSVPILMYHAVSDSPWGIEELFVSPEDLRAQLQYLTENGYDPIFFSDLPNLSDYDKPILLTFDDGYDDNYTELFPLLQEFGVKATVFVITGMLGDEHYMTAEQAREMSESGLVDIQSHTVDHHKLAELSYDDQEYQLAQSRLEAARITGKVPYVISYPSGSRNGDTLTLAPEYYSFGIDMNGGVWNTAEDDFQVDRIYVSRYDSLDSFIAKIS